MHDEAVLGDLRSGGVTLGSKGAAAETTNVHEIALVGRRPDVVEQEACTFHPAAVRTGCPAARRGRAAVQQEGLGAAGFCAMKGGDEGRGLSRRRSRWWSTDHEDGLRHGRIDDCRRPRTACRACRSTTALVAEMGRQTAGRLHAAAHVTALVVRHTSLTSAAAAAVPSDACKCKPVLVVHDARCSPLRTGQNDDSACGCRRRLRQAAARVGRARWRSRRPGPSVRPKSALTQTSLLTPSPPPPLTRRAEPAGAVRRVPPTAST